jgi:hypothetical protein
MVLSVFNFPLFFIDRTGLDLELSQILIIGHAVHGSLLEAVCYFNAVFIGPELMESLNVRVRWLFAGSIAKNLLRNT